MHVTSRINVSIVLIALMWSMYEIEAKLFAMHSCHTHKFQSTDADTAGPPTAHIHQTSPGGLVADRGWLRYKQYPITYLLYLKVTCALSD